MALHGDLKNMPLADVLQTLKMNRQAGTLTVQDGKKELHLFFDREQIRHVSPGKETAQYLVPVLLMRFDITDEKLQREIDRRGKRTIVEQLDKAHLADAATLRHLHALYLLEYLYDAFTWKKGTFQFVDGAKPGEPFDADQRAVALDMDVEQLVLESMRRLDEWKQIRRLIPTMDDVFVVSDMFKSQMIQLTEPSRSVIGLCNGEHSVTQIAYRLGIETFAAAHVIAQHLRSNVLRRIKAEDLAGLADRHLDKGDTAGALRFLKRSVELDGANMELRARYADLCRREGDISEATNEYKTLAQLAREREEYDKAKGFYRVLIEMHPSEYQVQERLYAMLQDQASPDAGNVGLELTATLRRLDLRKEESEHLLQMVSSDPSNVTLIEQLGDAVAAKGNRDEAAAHYARAAKLCVERSEIATACKLYEKALKAKPSDSKTARVLGDLRTGMYVEKARKRRRAIAITASSAVALLLAASVAYNAAAARAYLDMRNADLTLLGSGRFDTARESAKLLAKRYPLSLVLLDLGRYRQACDGLERARRIAIEAATKASVAAPTISKQPDTTRDSPLREAGQ